MPEPIHPPYNIVTPRQLDRWLDVNAQNGALTRTRGFVSVPTNSIGAITSLGQIVLTNNSVDDVTFDLLDIDGNVLESHQVVSTGNATFTTIANCYSILQHNHSNYKVFPYIGWTGTVSFNVDHTWSLVTIANFSNKIIQFNYSATHNFSIQNDASFKAFIATYQGIFSVCVANVIRGKNGNYNTVNRYRLTQPEIENTQAIQYNQQAILGGYFQIEFWSLSNFGGTVQPTASASILNTSVLGNLDYRYGNDFTIHSTGAVVVTNFNQTNPNSVGVFNLPITFNNNTINGLN